MILKEVLITNYQKKVSLFLDCHKDCVVSYHFCPYHKCNSYDDCIKEIIFTKRSSTAFMCVWRLGDTNRVAFKKFTSKRKALQCFYSHSTCVLTDHFGPYPECNSYDDYIKEIISLGCNSFFCTKK